MTAHWFRYLQNQVPNLKTSFVQGVGGMFGAMGSAVLTNLPPTNG